MPLKEHAVPDTLKVDQKCIVITGAVSPPTPLQIGGMSGTPSTPVGNGPAAGMMVLFVRNLDATNIAYLAWGATSAAAAANAVVPVSGTPQYVVPLPVSAGIVPDLVFPAGTFFTVVSGAGTPSVVVVPGTFVGPT
jgi:hypothetical protein